MKTVGAKLPKFSDIIAVLRRRQAARLAVFSPPIDVVQRTLILPVHGKLQIIIQTQHESHICRDKIKRKLVAYPVFMMMGVITQKLMQYLSACHTDLV